MASATLFLPLFGNYFAYPREAPKRPYPWTMPLKSLLPEEREFFALVADIAFTNPFGDDRRDAERRVSNWLGDPSSSSVELLFEAILPALELRLKALHQRGIRRLQQVHERDRRLLDYAWLFQIYHAGLNDWNRHIEAQLSVNLTVSD